MLAPSPFRWPRRLSSKSWHFLDVGLEKYFSIYYLPNSIIYSKLHYVHKFLSRITNAALSFGPIFLYCLYKILVLFILDLRP